MSNRSFNRDPIKILVVEDSKTQAEVLRRKLSERGYEVEVARDGQQGLQSVQTTPPDIVISDIAMPHMNGYQMCAAIKADENLKHLPVVLLSSLTDPDDIILGLNAKADNYLTKPYRDDVLFARIEHLLASRALSQSEHTQMGIEIYFAGKTHIINSDRKQILDLLISTFDNAVQKNRELLERTEELKKTNLTLQKQIAERHRIEGELEHARLAAESSSRVKSEFLANMSHEIRTPMNGIIGMANLLKETSLDESQQQYLGMLSNSAESLLQIIGDVLDLSKIEAGKLEIEHVDFSLRHTLDAALSILALSASEKGLRMRKDIADIPDGLCGDPTRLRQVLVNLLQNAVKFTARGEVGLEVHLEALRDKEVELRFNVRDSGIGISPENQRKIFAAFSQADGSTTRHYGGTGLGLAICSQLVEMMGGRIWVESEPGAGSVFYFTARFGLQTSDASPAATSPRAMATAEPLRILLAEDNAVNQLLAKRLLEKQGHAVVVVENGRQALEKLHDEDFGLVIMDVQMPEMDGFEATAALRAHEVESGGHLPIVAMTAHAMKDDQQRCLDAGMDSYIAKPIHIEQLKTAIAEAIECSERWGNSN